jgi:hypothetical protein
LVASGRKEEASADESFVCGVILIAYERKSRKKIKCLGLFLRLKTSGRPRRVDEVSPTAAVFRSQDSVEYRAVGYPPCGGSSIRLNFRWL